MPGRTKTRAISYKEVDSVSESSDSSSEDEEDQELKARLQASGGPLVKRKRTKKKKKAQTRVTNAKGSSSRASTRADPDDEEEDDTAWSGHDGPGEGTGKDFDDPRALQAANLLGKLPFELICEVFSYLDLSDLIQLGRTSPTLNAMLLDSSAQSIWSRSRRNAGYVLFPNMSEIKFALMMEGTLCQHCGAPGDLEMLWMARLCKDCMKEKAGPLHELSSDLSRHEQLLFCVESVTGAWDAWSRDYYTCIELETTNTALHEAQAVDDAEKATRPATSTPETAKHPSRVQQYVADRKRLLADRAEARKVNQDAKYRLELTLWDELLARRELGISLREGRTVEILSALQDRHNWTAQELIEIEVHLLGERDDHHFADGMRDLPSMLPDHAPRVWEHFKAKFLKGKRNWSYACQHDTITRERAQFVRSSYQAYMPALAVTLRTSVSDLPVWARMTKLSEVKALSAVPLTFLQAKPSAEYEEMFKRTARATMEDDRVTAIRYALAAQLDISVEQLSRDPADYPASKYNKLFFDRLINRFKVGKAQYLTYRHALETGYTAKTVSGEWQAARRRAIAHVLRAARIKETVCSLDKLDALGAAFRWTNGPHGYKSHKYNWRRMVDLLVQHGPKGLHLTDLQDVKLVYKRIKAVGERDKDASISASKLGEPEGGKTATSSSSDRLESNDMEMDTTTTNDPFVNASTSTSSPGTASAAVTAAATTTAVAAASVGLRRSTRLAPILSTDA